MNHCFIHIDKVDQVKILNKIN